MDAKVQDLIRKIEIDGTNIRYAPIEGSLWFVITDICKVIGANLANIYNRVELDTKKIKIKKQSVRVTSFQGVESILSTSRSEIVKEILGTLTKIIRNYKAKLIEKKYLFNQCYTCGLNGIWRNKPLDMILIDSNGTFLLCPNCYSQNDRIIFINTCQKCDRIVPIEHKFCLKCQNRTKPTKEKLKRDLTKHGMEGVEKKYGVNKIIIMSWMNDN